MGEHTKHSTSRVELRERIILAAVELFTTNGIKVSRWMRLPHLWVSLSALYEVFPDKETLLEECIPKSQKDGDIFVKGVIETSSNVLEVLLRCYQWSIERFHATNKKFLRISRNIPRLISWWRTIGTEPRKIQWTSSKRAWSKAFFVMMWISPLSICSCATSSIWLMNSDICNEYSFLEVYESIMFTFFARYLYGEGARVLRTLSANIARIR